jgi:pimeloyl-[acyl-carrier protein] synthase
MSQQASVSDPVPLFGPEMHHDPYPYYHKLRAIDPVYWSQRHQAWMVTGYDAVAAGLHDTRLSSDRSPLFAEMAGGGDDLKPFFSFLGKRMVFTDPPKHSRLRHLVSKAFTPHAVEAMRPHIQQVVDDLLDKVQDSGRIDLINDLAFALPATIIAEMLGVSPDNIRQLKQWSDKFIIFFNTHPSQISHQEYQTAHQAMQEMVEYFRAALPGIHQQPRPSLLETLFQAEQDGDRLSEEEVFANANLLMVAGHETTTNLIGNGMLSLLRHPDQMEMLRADPSLLSGAIEECLRHDNPVQFTNRVAQEDVVLGDKTIRQGQFVFLFVAAANRDPAHFPDPDRLDITREVHKHLAFGMGPHFCLGAPLARLEARIALETVLRRLANLRLATDALEYREGFNLRGLKSLPLAFG